MQITKYDIFAEIISRPGIHVVEDPDLESEAADIAVSHSFEVYRISGFPFDSKESLLSAISLSLNFPEYFGNNWDALEECLRELPIRNSTGCLLIFPKADALLKLPREQLIVLVNILSSAAAFWQAEGLCFVVLLIAGAELSIRMRS